MSPSGATSSLDEVVRRANLSVSVIRVSEIEFPTRIEAEFYEPEYIKNQKKLLTSGFPIKRLAEISRKITDGTHITPDYQESGIPFLMVRDVQEQYIDFGNTKFISDNADKQISYCKPSPGDILLTKVGTIGISAVVPEDVPSFNI